VGPRRPLGVEVGVAIGCRCSPLRSSWGGAAGASFLAAEV
jgi:hypothetical protein